MLKALWERLAESRQAFSSVFTNPNLRRVELSWAGTVCASRAANRNPCIGDTMP